MLRHRLVQPPCHTLLADYDYIRSLPLQDLAWEYLRRSPVYAKDWRLSNAGRPKPIHLRIGTTLIRTRRRWPKAERWGLALFC